MRTLLAVLRLLSFLMLVLFILPIHAVYYAFTGSMRMSRVFHTLACLIFGVRATWAGHINQAQRCLYVCNHMSYLDIIVLGAQLDAVFIAKSEVADWPLFGYLAKLQKTVFISRERAALKESQAKVMAAAAAGHNIILFPEGTSSNGQNVLPFKPGLFAAFLPDAGAVPDLDLHIVPLAMTLKAIDGVSPVNNSSLRDVYAWHGDMTLMPHLWAFAHVLRTDVRVTCLPALKPTDFEGRKELAQAVHTAVQDVLAVQNKAG